MDSAGFAVVVAKPQLEFEAETALRRRGYRTVLPIFRKRLRDGRVEMRAVFPNYLFVALGPAEAWVAILSTPNVNGVIRRGGQRDEPALLAPELVDAIRTESESGSFDDLVPAGAARAKAGDTVRVGPHAKFLAELQAVDARGRARALVGLFNRETVAEIDLERLAVVG